jgi:putative toxin-antitoxin system antitoxin component (TIGR02293 family)
MYVVAVESNEMRTRSRSAGAKISGNHGTKNHPKERQTVSVDDAAVDEERVPLSKRERQVLTTFHLLEQSADEILALMGLTETQFKMLKARAKARVGGLAKRSLSERHLPKTPTKSPITKSDSADFFADCIPVVAHALAVFGDEQKTSHWFATPLPILRGRTPSQVLAAEGGAEMIERILTRIEHNIPS